ncbi:protein DMP4-like [Nymphaea colorata]|nr:protein DMP4-like [Nymphaea colorata]
MKMAGGGGEILGRTEDEESQQTRPLLSNDGDDDQQQQQQREDRESLIQKAMSQTFRSTAHLANLLPTGTVLAFQLLSPIFTNQGSCDDAGRVMTAGLVALCALSCFVSCFTDSFKTANGSVLHGVATRRGLWVIDGNGGELDPCKAAEYSLKFIDFVHGFASVMVFYAVALLDQNVVHCFYPAPSEQGLEVLSSLPIGIGVFCSMIFVLFPTTRHGLGFSVTS